MALTICVLASSSSANCVYVASETTAMLIDAGLSARETETRLAAIGVDPKTLQGICISHEHADHVAGVGVLHKRYGMPVFANAGTIGGLRAAVKDRAIDWRVFVTGAPFTVGDLVVEPFSVPHDAYDPVGFVVTSGDRRLGVATDMGVVTHLIRERLRPCQVLVLETNHDEQLLRNSNRPWSLKQRILGRQGHLSNRHAAELLAELCGPQLQHVFLAHLSRECNEQDLALYEIRDRLGGEAFARLRVSLTYPNRPSDICVCA